jgi:hypothetical protein
MESEFARKARSLEDAFFFEEDQRLLESLREMRTLEHTTGLLSEVSGLSDPGLLLRLAELKVTPAAATSLAIAPLIAVVWADGKVSAVEREAVIDRLDDEFFFQTIDRDILEAWLSLPPPPSLLDAWEAYARELAFQLGPQERKALADEILGHARTLAEAAGAFFGLGGISEAEEAVLDRLGRALLHV